MKGDIFRVPTAAGAILVAAENGSQAVGFVRRGLKAQRLTGAEVRDLPDDAVIHDATVEDAQSDGADADPANAGGQTHDPAA